MSRKEWAIEIGAMLLVIALWVVTLFLDSTLWFIIALAGSAVILYALCWLALRKD